MCDGDLAELGFSHHPASIGTNRYRLPAGNAVPELGCLRDSLRDHHNGPINDFQMGDVRQCRPSHVHGSSRLQLGYYPTAFWQFGRLPATRPFGFGDSPSRRPIV